VHSRRYRAHEFNPGNGRSRFSPLTDTAGSIVPTMYAATSFGCAVYETIFHDIDPAAAFKSVPMSSIENLVGSVIEFDRDLRLARLFEPDLNKWGLTRASLIDTPPSTYNATQVWAAAIHEAEPAVDGMIWTSRRFDEEKCLILFGTRIDEAAIGVLRSDELARTPDLLEELVGLGRLSGIVLTL
jgi:hypothetical protein